MWKGHSKSKFDIANIKTDPDISYVRKQNCKRNCSRHDQSERTCVFSDDRARETYFTVDNLRSSPWYTLPVVVTEFDAMEENVSVN